MNRWNYGNAYQRHPIKPDQIAIFDYGSMVKVHNIFDRLPEFMLSCDLIFVDPPWNVGNLKSFYTKADRDDYQDKFSTFYNRLFECIAEIKAHTCYIEIGKDYLGEFLVECKKLYHSVTFYNSSYYHKRGNRCYVIRAAKKRAKLPLDDMDEEDIIAWICENEQYDCVGDLCIGRGLVGINAMKNDHRFMGTELNHKRLSVLLEKLVRSGHSYKFIEDKDALS